MSNIILPFGVEDAGGGYTTQRSVRLRSSASAYFNRTPASTSSRTTWTLSYWIKASNFGTNRTLLNVGGLASSYGLIFHNNADKIDFQELGGATARLTTTRVYRDPSSWYHIVCVWDSSNATAADRMRIYTNGVRETAFDTNINPALNAQSAINTASLTRIGWDTSSTASWTLDGYLTEVNFVDGQALTPSSFGEYDSVRNTQWKPKAYTGSYGTNGFYLKFSDPSSLEKLGADSSIGSTELISNSMFLSNTTGWTATNGAALAWQSGGLARVSNTASAAAIAGFPISTVIGQTYYVSTYIPTVALGAAGRSVGIYKSDAANLSGNPVFIGGTVAGGYRGTFVATATTTYISMFGDVYGASGYADFDYVSVGTTGYINSWAPTGIQTTNSALTTYDSMLDVPTLTSETASNFCTLNPLQVAGGTTTFSNGNLAVTAGFSTTYSKPLGTFAMSSGKWYWETMIVAVGSAAAVGVGDGSAPSTTTGLGGAAGELSYVSIGNRYSNNITTAYGSTYTTNDVIGIAYDADVGSITFYKNGVSQGTITGLSGTKFPGVSATGAVASQYALNFGQQPFVGTVPTGFKPLNTYNLPDPAITSSDDYHKVYTYTGNGGGLQVGEIQKPMSLYNLDRSLRFRASASAYLNRTTASAGNRKTWTWSGWVKRGTLGGSQMLFANNFAGAGGLHYLQFNSDTLFMYIELSTGIKTSWQTTAVFKDPNMWYHVVVVFDTTQAVVANMGKVYVNGVLQTITTANYSASYISQNADGWINASGYAHYVGSGLPALSGQNHDGYLADVNFIDGYALDPTNFGQFDGNYYWTPKAYTGTYGTNGFHLEFEDFSAATAAAIGKDTSGNGNNWTPSAGINLTVPANTNASWDSMVDVPTLTSADVANFATANPLNAATGLTISDGNLKLAASAVGSKFVTSTIPLPVSGLFYSELTFANTATASIGQTIGIQTATRSLTAVNNAVGAYLFYASAAGALVAEGTTTASSLATITAGETFQLAIDLTNNKMWIGRGDVWYNATGGTTGNPSTGANPTFTGSFAGYLPYAGFDTASAVSANWNFGQRPFRYTPPTGFKSLNSFNVAEVTGDLESPDFVWIKSRSAGTSHALFNKLVGAGKYVSTNGTTVETTDVNSLIQFNKNGFLLGNGAVANTLSATYVASAWKKGVTPGLDVQTFTRSANGVTTFNHNLGVAPSVVIVKGRTIATGGTLSHTSLGMTSAYLTLNSPNLRTLSANALVTNTATQCAIGTDYNTLNGDYVAYLFAEVPGFSKFTSYAANGSSTGDGPYVFCGFSPRWIMIKRATGASGTGGWIMYDTARSTYNTMSEYLFGEGAAGGNTLAAIDVTANGFKIKTNNVHLNQTSGDIYIVMAFAEHPFKYALAR